MTRLISPIAFAVLVLAGCQDPTSPELDPSAQPGELAPSAAPVAAAALRPPPGSVPSVTAALEDAVERVLPSLSNRAAAASLRSVLQHLATALEASEPAAANRAVARAQVQLQRLGAARGLAADAPDLAAIGLAVDEVAARLRRSRGA